MNVSMLVKLVGPVISAAGKIKRLVWSDGVFKVKRAAIMLAMLAVIIFGVYFIGADNMAIAIELLDEVSDAIGYAE